MEYFGLGVERVNSSLYIFSGTPRNGETLENLLICNGAVHIHGYIRHKVAYSKALGVIF